MAPPASNYELEILDIIDLEKQEKLGDDELLLKLQIASKVVTIN